MFIPRQFQDVDDHEVKEVKIRQEILPVVSEQWAAGAIRTDLSCYLAYDT